MYISKASISTGYIFRGKKMQKIPLHTNVKLKQVSHEINKLHIISYAEGYSKSGA